MSVASTSVPVRLTTASTAAATFDCEEGSLSGGGGGTLGGRVGGGPWLGEEALKYIQVVLAHFTAFVSVVVPVVGVEAADMQPGPSTVPP